MVRFIAPYILVVACDPRGTCGVRPADAISNSGDILLIAALRELKGSCVILLIF